VLSDESGDFGASFGAEVPSLAPKFEVSGRGIEDLEMNIKTASPYSRLQVSSGSTRRRRVGTQGRLETHEDGDQDIPHISARSRRHACGIFPVRRPGAGWFSHGRVALDRCPLAEANQEE